MTDAREPKRALPLWQTLRTPAPWNVVTALLVGVAVATFAAILVLQSDATYSSRSVVEMYTPEVFLEPNPGPITKLNALRRKYAALVNTVPIISPAAEALGVDPSRVAGATSVAITEDSLIMYPTARADSSDAARRIADAVTNALVDYVAEEQAEHKVPKEQRIELRVVQAAAPGGKIEPRRQTAVSSAVIAGVAAVALAYVLMQLVAPPRTRR